MSIINQITSTKTEYKELSASISQITYDELPVLLIQHKTCQAAVTLHGAHILYWQPSTQTSPVVWLSDDAIFKNGVAIRGGIPICWPWFGNFYPDELKKHDATDLPMHGLVRTLTWQLKSYQEDDHGVDLVLSLSSSNQTMTIWPHEFELEAVIHLGETCALTLNATGDFVSTAALHSYFGVSDIAQVTVTGLGGDYIERLNTQNEPKKAGEMNFNQEVDRIYTQPESTSLIHDNHRTIKVEHINSTDVVTWNPWIAKTKTLKDMPDESYKEMVCVESCRINKPVTSKNNKGVVLGVVISVINI